MIICEVINHLIIIDFILNNASYRFEYVLSVFQYFYFYYNIFPFLKLQININTSKNVYYTVEFYTRALPCFTEYKNIFYKNKVKILPEDIYNLLDPISLAHLIMGDGSKKKNKKITWFNSLYGLFYYTRGCKINKFINN
jgi:hypothetical protein